MAAEQAVEAAAEISPSCREAFGERRRRVVRRRLEAIPNGPVINIASLAAASAKSSGTLLYNRIYNEKFTDIVPHLLTARA